MPDPFLIALSILSGRVDVCDLSGAERHAVGIHFDPKGSVALRNEALILIEGIVAKRIQG